jgi:hypothetical protein
MIHAIDRNLSDGARIVIAFTLIWYVLPAFASAFVDLPVIFLWPSGRSDVWGHFAIAIGCLTIPAVLAGWSRPAAPVDQGPGPLPIGTLALAFAAIAIGAAAFATGASSWRYGGAAIAERVAGSGGAMVLATAILQAVAPCLAWWVMLMLPRYWSSGSGFGVLLRLSVAVASMAGINGLNSAIRALFASACMLWPRSSRRVLFDQSDVDEDGSFRRRFLAITWIGVALLAVAFAVAGMAAKTGSSAEVDWEGHTDPAYLLRRHSVHFQHAMGALELGIDEAHDARGFGLRSQLTWLETSYRLGVLAGDPTWARKPEPASLSRWTLERFANFDLRSDTRSGSSPGVIGTAALCLAAPWSFVAIAGFSFLAVRGLDWFLDGCERLSPVGCAMFAFIPLRFVTDMPLNLTNPVSVPAVVIGLAIAARVGRSMYIRRQPCAPNSSPDHQTCRR